MSATIDIVVPVYDGAEQTRRCLEGVRRCAQRTPFELVLVDDATPRAEIAAFLDGLAREAGVTLLRNAANEGFVRSVNRGMGAAPGSRRGAAQQRYRGRQRLARSTLRGGAKRRGHRDRDPFLETTPRSARIRSRAGTAAFREASGSRASTA
jgi:hypothetical protein